jgi:predicted TIM-barrel fold metal-dependent hydrolase
MTSSPAVDPSTPFRWLSAGEGPVIDADVHVNVPSHEALSPYLSSLWRQVIAEREWEAPAGQDITYPPNAPSTCLEAWRPPDGRLPASSLDLVQEQILDPCALERAVLTCYYAVDSIRNPDWAKALASAVNDWLISDWFDRDERLVGSLVVPARSPEDMAAEIERVGDHPRFVQVLLPVRSDRLYGHRVWHPVYESVVRHDLAVGIHWGGTSEGAPTATGWPTWYVEEYAAEIQVYASQVTSLVAEGVFQRFPSLRVTVLEGGFAWLPAWLWRMDKDWKGLRREIPWVNRPPSEIVRDHMRFTTSPIDVPSVAELGLVLEWLQSDDLLLFSSDYPHVHGDDPALLLEAIPDADRRAKLLSGNARAWYRL